jgi:phosphate transport system protein
VFWSDDALYELKTEAFRELLACMLHDSRTIEATLNLVLVSRHLERIGDHATNIAEDLIFIVAAKDVRHAEATRELTSSLTPS